MTVTMNVLNFIQVLFERCVLEDDSYANLARVIEAITADRSNVSSLQRFVGIGPAARLTMEIRKLNHMTSRDDWLTWDEFKHQINEKTLLDLPITSSEPLTLSSSSSSSSGGYFYQKQQSSVKSSSIYDDEKKSYLEFLRNYDATGELLSIVNNSSKEAAMRERGIPPPITSMPQYKYNDRDHTVHERIDRMMSEKGKGGESPDVDTRMRTMSEDEAEEMRMQQEQAGEDYREVFLRARYTELSPDEAAQVDHSLRQPNNANDARPMLFDIPIVNSTIVRLSPRVWLNDEIINFYMFLLLERDRELCKHYPNRVPSYFFNSYFIAKLLDEGRPPSYNYANVKRWSTRAQINIFKLNRIYFPVNISNNHWTMALIDMQKKEICYYDSFHSRGERYLEGLMRYVIDEGRTKHDIVVSRSEWTLKSGGDDTPFQTNGTDCGVFSIMCADFLSDDLPLSYHQSEMTGFRRKICADILRGRLSYPLSC